MRNRAAASQRLSREAENVVWRIFGSGTSPMTARPTYERIVPVVSSLVPSHDQDRDTTEIQGWFEKDQHSYRLKSESEQLVASLIVDGVRGTTQDHAVWAVAAIDAEVMAPMIRSRWSSAEVVDFVGDAVAELQRACEQDVVLDPSRWGQIEPGEAARARVPRDGIEKEGRLSTFGHLAKWVRDPVLYGICPAVSALMGLVLELRPEYFLELVGRLDHPVVQFRLSWLWRTSVGSRRDEDVLDWISGDACDPVIALAIWETLEGVNARLQDSSSADDVSSVTEPKVTSANANEGRKQAIAERVRMLVDRLSGLNPVPCARWIGELLGYGSRAFGITRDGQKPAILEVMEEAGHAVLAKEPESSRFEILVREFEAGLRRGGEQRWHRHQATLAWSLRTASPDRAVDLAKGVLKEYRRHLDDKNRRLEVDWRDWLDREWAEGMGRAVALINEDPDLCAWAVGQCRGLPLKAWDAEEDVDCFQEAERIADTWFLIAFMAIEARQELEERIEPAVVRRLTQSYWAHGEFVDRYLWSRRSDGIGAEIAARYAVHFGEACDGWILRQAKLERLGASAVFGLLSQRERDAQGRASVSTDGHEEFVTEMVRIMGRRFDDEAPFELPQLELWGRVWLCLRAVDQAEETAREILWSRRQPVDRRYEILALRLLALVVGVCELGDDLRNEVVQLYKRVWPAHAGTPSEEKTDKQKIAKALVASGLLSRAD